MPITPARWPHWDAHWHLAQVSQCWHALGHTCFAGLPLLAALALQRLHQRLMSHQCWPRHPSLLQAEFLTTSHAQVSQVILMRPVKHRCYGHATLLWTWLCVRHFHLIQVHVCVATMTRSHPKSYVALPNSKPFFQPLHWPCLSTLDSAPNAIESIQQHTHQMEPVLPQLSSHQAKH